MPPEVLAAARVAVSRVRQRHIRLTSDDLMQEALLGAWLAHERCGEGRSTSEAWAYLVQRAEGSVRDAMRTARRLDGRRRDGTGHTDVIPLQLDPEVDRGSCPLGSLAVKRAMAALPPRERHVVDLLLLGHTQTEIAESMGHDPSWVYQIKQSALRRLRKHL